MNLNSFWDKKHLKLNLGCGDDYRKEYVNCDIVGNKKTDLIMDCSSLEVFNSDSADLIFCHSFFEHLYIYQQDLFLKECKRVLNKTGVLLILGIPDFWAIAKTYVNHKAGINPFKGTFNLYQVYRLTHGDFEGNGKAYIPQMHKTIFDLSSLYELMGRAKFPYFQIINYAYPNEQYQLNFCLIASKEKRPDKAKLKQILIEQNRYIGDIENITNLL